MAEIIQCTSESPLRWGTGTIAATADPTDGWNHTMYYWVTTSHKQASKIQLTTLSLRGLQSWPNQEILATNKYKDIAYFIDSPVEVVGIWQWALWWILEETQGGILQVLQCAVLVSLGQVCQGQGAVQRGAQWARVNPSIQHLQGNITTSWQDRNKALVRTQVPLTALSGHDGKLKK